jgi:hydrogenase-4 membrane subunit HyfE
MIFNEFELVVIAAAVTAILMAGSSQLKMNLFLYSVETLLIGSATAITAYTYHETNLYYIALAIALLKGIAIPIFLSWTIDKINIKTDIGTMVPAPLAMHLTVILLGLSYLIVSGLPVPLNYVRGWPGATAASSLLFSGLVLMLTRRVAISQIIGFLVLENGIYLFALTQTRGMPMIVEMGVLLDVLAGAMIAGLLVFKIQRSFEHIDTSLLSDLKD